MSSAARRTATSTSVPSAPATIQPLATIDGWPVNVATLPDAVERITDAAAAQQSFSCFTLNLDHLVKLRTNAQFRDAYRTARFVTADGEPVARIARRRTPGVVRTTGADMFVPLMRRAAERDTPVYLFGTSLETLETTVAELDRTTGGKLRVVGYEAPAMGFDPTGAEADRAMDRVARSGAGLCMVMLGAPKQEVFAARAVSRGIPAGFVCVGAAADFIAGSQVRAPMALQNAGLEWAWRLMSNPRRLGMRYARCAMLLAQIELGNRLGLRDRPT